MNLDLAKRNTDMRKKTLLKLNDQPWFSVTQAAGHKPFNLEWHNFVNFTDFSLVDFNVSASKWIVADFAPLLQL
jgi:hypothetical protein